MLLFHEQPWLNESHVIFIKINYVWLFKRCFFMKYFDYDLKRKLTKGSLEGQWYHSIEPTRIVLHLFKIRSFEQFDWHCIVSLMMAYFTGIARTRINVIVGHKMTRYVGYSVRVTVFLMRTLGQCKQRVCGHFITNETYKQKQRHTLHNITHSERNNRGIILLT